MRFNLKHLYVAILSTLTAPTFAETQKHHFEIAAQTLSSALQAFAAQSGDPLLYAEQTAIGKHSQRLSGNYTTREAAAILLADSGLEHQVAADGTVTVKPGTKPTLNKESADVTLKPMVVIADEESNDLQGAENDPFSKNYAITSSNTATKTDTPIMDTPLSIQVIPRAIIEDQQSIRVGDALRNVSGYIDSRGEEFTYDTSYLRGFSTGSRQYIDGMRDLPQSHSLAMIERIDVLKGPAGALYGRLDPGGLINYVTKRPLASSYYSLQQQFSSFDTYRTLADATGPLTTKGSLLYRINMEYLGANSYIDAVHKERGFVSTSLTWNVSQKTKVDLDFRFHDVNGPTTFGLPALSNRPANIPISRFMGEPGTDDGDSNLLYGGIGLSHAFTENWKLNANVAYNYEHQFSNGTFIDVLDENTGDASRFYSDYDYAEDSIQGIVNLNGKINIFGLKHDLTIGSDLYQTDGRNISGNFLCESCETSYPAPINIYQPIIYGKPGINLAQETPAPANSGRTSWWGFYFQDQITLFKNWHLMFGTRYDQAHTSWDDSETTNDGEFSPRVGLLYRPLNWLSVYANYVKAMNAENSSRLAPGLQRKPEKSEGYEAGFKGEWLNGKLNASLTFYELTKKNISVSHYDESLAAQGYNILVGEGRSQGIELDFSGQVAENLNLIATYTLTNTEYTKDQSNIIGNQFANVPTHAGSLWTKYDFGGLGLNGLWTGAGLYLYDNRQGDRQNSFQLPGYTRVDAGLGYSFQTGLSKISLQFNIDNLLDKQYFSASTWEIRAYGIQPGAPRTFMGSMRVEF